MTRVYINNTVLKPIDLDIEDGLCKKCNTPIIKLLNEKVEFVRDSEEYLPSVGLTKMNDWITTLKRLSEPYSIHCRMKAFPEGSTAISHHAGLRRVGD